MNINYPIEMQEKTAAALRYLRSLQLDDNAVDALWRAHTRKCEDLDRGEPTEWDRMYTVPKTAPSIGDHFPDEGGLPACLDAHNMWPGYHYTLSAGQRKWFREVMGMTPARTITIAWVQTFPGTQHCASFKFESDTHVDPRNRRHVITSAIVRNVGRFFFESALFDSEIRAEGLVDEVKEKKKGKSDKKATTTNSTRSLADIMKDLEENC